MEFFLRAAIALFERETSFRFFKLYFSLSLSLSLSLCARSPSAICFSRLASTMMTNKKESKGDSFEGAS